MSTEFGKLANLSFSEEFQLPAHKGRHLFWRGIARCRYGFHWRGDDGCGRSDKRDFSWLIGHIVQKRSFLGLGSKPLDFTESEYAARRLPHPARRVCNKAGSCECRCAQRVVAPFRWERRFAARW